MPEAADGTTDAALLTALLALSEPDRRSVLARLTERQLRELRKRWAMWAHGGQRAPAGDWRVWLIREDRAAAVAVTVRQLGTLAESRAAAITIPAS